MIRAAVFDFGNVICRFDVRHFVERISRQTSTPVSAFHDILDHSFDIGREYETGLISSDEFYRRVSGRYGFSLSKEEFVNAFTEIFTPIPTTGEVIRKLKPHYKLGLLSNTNHWHFEYAIKTADVFPLFDAVTLSFEVKAMKPAEKMYRDILAKLQVGPGECIYIDDIKENVEAGARMGMHGIHYTTPEELYVQLRRMNVDA